MIALNIGRFGLAMPILLALSQLSAEPPQKEPDKVKVSVVAILAHGRDDVVDPRLKCIAEEIHKAVPKLTGFQMGKMSCKMVAIGERETFELVDDQVATVVIVQSANKETQIELTPPSMGEVSYETCCSRFFTIITKYRSNKNKDVLIIAVRVQPCQK